MAIFDLNRSHFSRSVVSLIKTLFSFLLIGFKVIEYSFSIIEEILQYNMLINIETLNRNFNINAHVEETTICRMDCRIRGIEQWYWLFREEGKQSSPSNPFQHPCTNPRVPRGDRWAPAMLWALWVMG